MNGRGLRLAAEAVLRGNDAGAWTRPSAEQYPHQWNWDSAFAAIGWAHLDWNRACVEIESLLDAQWDDGMIPHVRYDPRHLDGYFPGPDRWPRAQGRSAAGVPTSGISNPPVLALAARIVGERQPDLQRRHAFWRRVLGGLERWSRWWLDRRTLPGEVLPAVVHPWETGWDNSPRWDRLRAARLKPARAYARRDQVHVPAAQRPGARDYDAYLALAELLDAAGYDIERYAATAPFLVNDVVIDALCHRSMVELNVMARAVGENPPFASGELARFREAFEQRHADGDAGLYDWDLLTGDRIRTPTPAGVVALIAGFATPLAARATWRRYASGHGDHSPLWTVPPGDPLFDEHLYWRGPVWAPVNWLAFLGLRDSGCAEEAEHVRQATLRLVARSGFSEHFSPISGAGGGAQSLSWTAAVALDLVGLDEEVLDDGPGGS